MANDSLPVEAALDAVGNPTRRRLLRLLREGETTVGRLADELPVTQPAVSQHLRVLRDAGLIKVRPEGARNLYSIDLDGMTEIRAWVDGFWDDVLSAFAAHANRSGSEPTSSRRAEAETYLSEQSEETNR